MCVGEASLDQMLRISFWGGNRKLEKKDRCVDIWKDHFKQREQTMVKMRNGK